MAPSFELGLDLRKTRDDVRQLLATCAERLAVRESRIAAWATEDSSSSDDLGAAVEASRADLDRITKGVGGLEGGLEAQQLAVLRERAAASKDAAAACADALDATRSRIEATRAAVLEVTATDTGELRDWFFMPAARASLTMTGGRSK